MIPLSLDRLVGKHCVDSLHDRKQVAREGLVFRGESTIRQHPHVVLGEMPAQQQRCEIEAQPFQQRVVALTEKPFDVLRRERSRRVSHVATK